MGVFSNPIFLSIRFRLQVKLKRFADAVSKVLDLLLGGQVL